MSSKLNSGVRHAYMRGGADWKCLRMKADMLLFAGNTVSSISVRVTFTFTCSASNSKL